MTLELHEDAAIRAVLRDEWDALQPRLIAIAQRVVRRREVAEEVVSSTVVELIERVDAGESIREPAAYLARGVRFRAIDVVRSRDGQAVVGTEVADDAIASIADTRLGAMSVDDLDALSPVREAFGALSERHREVLARTVIDDEPVRVVAREWAMTPNAVAVLALRARRALHAQLKVVLMERAGGACARHARSSDRAALAHVARCSHCREVRAGRGVGRWVLGLMPLLLGGGAAVLAPARVARAAVGSVARQPLLAMSALGTAAVATTAIVVGVTAFSPVGDSPVIAAQPTSSASAPAADPVPSSSADETSADAVPSVVAPADVAPTVGSVGTQPAPAPQGIAPPPTAEPVASVDPIPAAPPVAPTEPPAPADPPDPTERLDPVVPVEPPEPVEPAEPIEPEVPAPAAPPAVSTSWIGDSLLSLPIGTVTLSGLIPGATYELSVEGGSLSIAGASGGLTCGMALGATASCTASAAEATVTIVAVDLLLCGQTAALRLAHGDPAVQQPLVAPLGPVTCI